MPDRPVLGIGDTQSRILGRSFVLFERGFVVVGKHPATLFPDLQGGFQCAAGPAQRPSQGIELHVQQGAALRGIQMRILRRNGLDAEAVLVKMERFVSCQFQ